MHRNVERCLHCGRKFVQVTPQTPNINRSDGKSFHLSLYSGPDVRSARSKRLANQVLCNFTYVHDRLGPGDISVVVSILNGTSVPEDLIQHVEAVADKLEELVVKGRKLEAAYTFSEGVLIKGLRT